MPDNLNLPSDVETWYKGVGVDFFKKLNVKENQRILDFGSRIGNYSIPIAQIIGENGKVFALDVNHDALDELMERAKFYNLDNIFPIKTDGELKIKLPDNSIDIILFYDVIYPICRRKGLKAYNEILSEFHRILKKDGILSILFAHLDDLDLTIDNAIEITVEKFDFIGELEHLTMHWNLLKNGIIHNFRKK
ncbi:MAG TPA: class I SAM-dependent methyltransferase [candidate division Zixibacteria bacterium]|nr:class I SAM-dependent methyltransferase [candidate division Zixibacteria bacterium]